ncbi:hypothetical protein [Noviherbaspirillum saxi]|uniref:Uncharacterized protein n=1 Tax=Noviherbaspirillum saxi TaxID=2320863 RepID=A0A3A3FU63_9BURK|nr:hypothetical protein [Noviherbaspirillum saxi]RJF99080.1 hypothetical protein D3871_11555 [Noviherbaspirillum saxi]
MAHTLVRVYDHMADAEHAREQLLKTGFPESHVQLSATGDEAGALQGNFVVDRKEEMRPDRRSFLDTLHNTNRAAGDNISHHADTSAPQRVVYRSNFVLTVDAESAEQESQANSILDQSGAIDVDAVVYRRNRES